MTRVWHLGRNRGGGALERAMNGLPPLPLSAALTDPSWPYAGLGLEATWRAVGWNKAAALSEAQNHRCCYCGVRFAEGADHPASMTIEHLVRRADGGRREWLNEVAACRSCNNMRHELDPMAFESLIRGGRFQGYHDDPALLKRLRRDLKVLRRRGRVAAGRSRRRRQAERSPFVPATAPLAASWPAPAAPETA